METNLYTMTVAPIMNSLEALKGILDKAAAHAASKQLSWEAPGLQEDALLQSRLISDQFAFARQVQIACDNGKGVAARLAEIENPKHEDTEKTVEELKTRIDKTLAFMLSVKPEQIIGKEEIRVSLPYWDGKSLSGYEYVTRYLIPNFYFHMTTAYSILRSNGVAIGKDDFTGPLSLK